MAQTHQRPHQAHNRVYQDFEPSYEWAQDEESDTLILMLKGFRKENLRVQIGTNRRLKLRGEQQMSGNKWHRFNKEYTIPPHSNTNGIKAKLQGGLLYIRLPKSGAKEAPKQEEPKTSEVSQTNEMGRVVQDNNTSESEEMHEKIDELGNKGKEKKVEQRLPTTLYGLVGEVVKQMKVANLMVLIFLLLGMGIYVKNVIKSSFGGSTIQHL